MNMMFAKKLKQCRDEIGISQEQLAEKLGLSRQAVAKWEAGSGMPDLDNLVAISNFFQVTIDSLLKKNGYMAVSEKTNHKGSELVAFIVEAKKSTYASAASFSNSRVTPSRLASKDLAFEAGDYKYLDTYVGGANFSGTEVVYYQENPVWSMNYNGRSLIEETDGLIAFLTVVLGSVQPDLPFRGPTFYRDGKYTYFNTATGASDWFQGEEKIYYEESLIYELVYHGGTVK